MLPFAVHTPPRRASKTKGLLVASLRMATGISAGGASSRGPKAASGGACVSGLGAASFTPESGEAGNVGACSHEAAANADEASRTARAIPAGRIMAGTLRDLLAGVESFGAPPVDRAMIL